MLVGERTARMMMQERADRLVAAVVGEKVCSPDFVDPLINEVIATGKANGHEMQGRGASGVKTWLLGGSRMVIISESLNRLTPEDVSQRRGAGKATGPAPAPSNWASSARRRLRRGRRWRGSTRTQVRWRQHDRDWLSAGSG